MDFTIQSDAIVRKPVAAEKSESEQNIETYFRPEMGINDRSKEKEYETWR